MTLQERDERMREEGQRQLLVSLVCKQLARGKTPQAIVEDMEEFPIIRKICDVASGFAPEYPEDDVLAALESGKENNHETDQYEMQKLRCRIGG